MNRRLPAVAASFILMMSWLAGWAAAAQMVTSTLTVGSSPGAVAVNPVTNKIYVANHGDGTVTVIDGVTNTTATVIVGSSPSALAVNPVTDQIYVANQTDGSVTVIDGATSTATATITVGTSPQALAVNLTPTRSKWPTIPATPSR